MKKNKMKKIECGLLWDENVEQTPIALCEKGHPDYEFWNAVSHIKFEFDFDPRHHFIIKKGYIPDPPFDALDTIFLWATHDSFDRLDSPYRILLTFPDKQFFKYDKRKEHNTLDIKTIKPGLFHITFTKNEIENLIIYNSKKRDESYLYMDNCYVYPDKKIFKIGISSDPL
jgi:hypothetical protein